MRMRKDDFGECCTMGDEILVCRCFAGRLSVSPHAFIAARRRAPSSSFSVSLLLTPDCDMQKEKKKKRREEKKRTTTTSTKTFVFLDATRLLFLIALARARLSLLLSAGLSLSLDEKSTKTFGIDRASALRPTPRAVVAVVLAQKGRKTYVRRSMAQRRGSDLPLSPSMASASVSRRAVN